ncbi:MAG TPA: S9 family peptidase [Gemmatimonadaceae bacterium]|jgi:dipeptidyl aminopeptidase/acylaminoacyl peptidase|nr:S9 family peptidase [Gemmatimonadaceae bacterium]
MRRLIPAVVLALLAAGTAAAQGPINPVCLSNENLREYSTPGSAALSPDGQRVAFVVREATIHKAVSHIWWARTDAARSARQVTYGTSVDEGSESDPEWMPDGSAMLFLARRGDHRQVYRLPMDGGEAAPLNIQRPGKATDTGAAGDSSARAGDGGGRTVDVGSYDISPDGKWLAISVSEPEPAAERKRRADRNDATVVDHDERPQHIWLYSLADSSLTMVGTGAGSAGGVSWSPDSRHLAIVTHPLNNADDLGPDNALYIADVTDPSNARQVAGAPKTVSSVSWSPDGAQLAFSAQTMHDAPPGVSDLFVMPSAGGTPRDITGSSGVEVRGDTPVWAADGSAFYGSVADGTTSRLARIDVGTGRATYLDTDAPVASGFATNAGHTGWAYVASASDRPPEVAFTPNFRQGGAVVRLSRVNPAWPDTGWTRAQQVEWKSRDGMTIRGLLFVPPASGCNGQPRDARFPLILNVHGGPTGNFSQSFSPFVQWQLAQGWAVLEPNPRGSTGYGWQFAAANRNDLGGHDYEDVMAGVDYVIAHQPVDTMRLGMYGYSYGGEMAGFIEGRTDRFAAIVSGAPVIDQFSEYGTEGGSWYDRWYFGQPWRRPADALRQSPLSRAQYARTPFLLLQGEEDTTDPLGQSQEMYRALRQEGVEVRLVTFPRENHGGLGGPIAGNPSREPWHGFEARKQILEWFNSHFPRN